MLFIPSKTTMPKSLLIDPAEARQRGMLTAPAIPLNAYRPDPKAEAAKYGRDNLVRMYRDMALIREFETMLDRIKKDGAYEGISYNHKGPAHLSIGQEAAAVGQSYHLSADDFIFGSHRSHGEIIAKSLSAIARMSEAGVQQVMESYQDGALLRVVERLPLPPTSAALAVGSSAWPSTSCSTARWPRSSGEPPASTAAWAAACTHSFRHSA